MHVCPLGHASRIEKLSSEFFIYMLFQTYKSAKYQQLRDRFPGGLLVCSRPWEREIVGSTPAIALFWTLLKSQTFRPFHYH